MSDQIKAVIPQDDGSVPRLHTVADLTAILQLGDARVRALIHSGELPGIRIGAEWRVSARDLQAFLDARRATVPAPTSDSEVRQ